MEVPLLNGLTSADIYIRDIDLVININGPKHYYRDLPDQLIPSLHSRIPSRFRQLDLKFDMFTQFLDYGTVLPSASESNFKEVKKQLKARIEQTIK